MKYRQFGKTGWQVSEIAFGAWQLGGTWGAVDNSESIDTLLHAFESGINFVDTAIAYGNGHSETLVGQALQQWSGEHIFVSTKVLPKDLRPGNADQLSMRGQYPFDYLRDAVDGSLRRLQVECIDLLQLHLWIEDGMQHLDWLDSLVRLVDGGKIRAFGVSLPDIQPASGVLLAKCGLVSSQQVIFNLFEQEPADTLFRAGESTSTAFIARVPFDSGALTGSWNQSTYAQWSEDDKRHEMYRDGRFEETLERVTALEALCADYYPGLAEAAMRFCLSDSAVSTVACGMRNRAEVDMNTAWSDGHAFPTELRTALAPHAWKHSFYQ